METDWTTKGPLFESLPVQELSVLHILHTDIVVHPASYPMGTWSLSPGVKRPDREADHSHPNSTEVKKT
jgi:hypothetical protein